MSLPLVMAALTAIIGYALMIAGVYVVAGLGWALMVAAGLTFIFSAVIVRGLRE